MCRFHAIEEKFAKELQQVKEDIAALRCEILETTSSSKGHTKRIVASKEVGSISDEDSMYKYYVVILSVTLYRSNYFYNLGHRFRLRKRYPRTKGYFQVWM